jgi:hypothetical protein
MIVGNQEMMKLAFAQRHAPIRHASLPTMLPLSSGNGPPRPPFSDHSLARML